MYGIVIGIGIILSSMGLWIACNQARVTLYAYVHAIDTGDFKKAYALIDTAPLQPYQTEEDIIHYLESYYTQPTFRELRVDSWACREDEGIAQTPQKVFPEVTHVFQENSIQTGLRMIKIEDKWRVVFPFKMTDVTIQAPLGTDVYFQGEKLAKQQGLYEVKQLLPGEYTVHMAFFEGLQAHYETTIQVPQEQNVSVPYETTQLVIQVVEGVEVTLGNETRVSTREGATFDDVLPGEYTVGIYDPNAYFADDVQVVNVTETTKCITLAPPTLTANGRQKVTAYLATFYKAYEQAIKEQKIAAIQSYFINTEDSFWQVFDAWFVQNKLIKEATVTTHIEHIETIADGTIEVEVLENIEMTNGAALGDEKYRITLVGVVKLQPNKQALTITDKTITQSMVAYQDQAGEWVTY